MSKCSIFKDVFTKVEPKNIEVARLLSGIKFGKWQNKIHQIRAEIDIVEKKRLKSFLPSICFSGTFNTRFDNDMIDHSGFVVLDFDHVENLLEKKAEFCNDEYTYSCFISPSGDGLKVLVKIPADKKDHREYYRGLMEKYPTLDSTSRNESRVCFVSYDPELYFNENSKVFTTKLKFEKSEQSQLEAEKTDYSKIEIAANMIRNAPDGEKHKALIKASYLIGGFIASGMVEEYEAVRILTKEIEAKGNVIDLKAAQKTIDKGVAEGKKEPIYEKDIKEKVKKIQEKIIIIEGEPSKDVIYLQDIKESIIYSFINGTSRGETTHISELDEVFRMSRRELNIVHGIANHGKSEFTMQLALIKAVKENYKWGIFSPENYPAEEFYKSIVHAYIGKSTERHHNNQMTIEELHKGMDFVKDHFYFMYPENDSPTPDYINSRFQEMILKHNIDGCIIDPYNQLDTDLSNTGGKEHLYLSKFLSKEKKFAVDHNVFFFVITHPKGDMERVNGNYKMPQPYSLSGGAMWVNKADNILCVHRPNYSDRADGSVDICSQKIKKQKLNGIPGTANLTFDRLTNRYSSLTCSPLNNDFGTIEIPLTPSTNFHEPKENYKKSISGKSTDEDSLF